ncbi:hypothetical protein D3C80_1683580 [compost metagenome]
MSNFEVVKSERLITVKKSSSPKFQAEPELVTNAFPFEIAPYLGFSKSVAIVAINLNE